MQAAQVGGFVPARTASTPMSITFAMQAAQVGGFAPAGAGPGLSGWDAASVVDDASGDAVEAGY